jgi:hypothetical protein
VREIEYEELKSGSCFVGDCLCYHAQSPHEYAATVAKDLYDGAARENMPILHFIGMGRGFIQSELARIMPDAVKLVCWDEHPNLTEEIVPPADLELIKKRWVLVHEADEFAAEVGKEGQGARRMLAIQPNMNEVMHWALGFIDWMKRDRRHFRGCRPLNMIPSPRSIGRIAQFGRIPGVHQMNHVGERDAVIVSAGPSLNEESAKAISTMVQRGAVVFAAAQAVKKLNEWGIVPHFAVVADPSDIMYEFVKDAKFGVVICEGMVSEYFINDMADRIVLFNIMSSHAHQAAADMLDWPSFDDSFATVTEISMCMARVMGAGRLFLVGCDFGADKSTIANPFPRYQSSFRMPTYDGSLVWTNAHYNHARRWVETHLRNPQFTGSLHRYAVGLPVRGEVRYEDPMKMAMEVKQLGPMKMPKAPHARESDLLGAAIITSYLRRRGYDAGDAVNYEHPEDFRYTFMGASHERKQTLIEIALNRMIGKEALGDAPMSAGAEVVEAVQGNQPTV